MIWSLALAIGAVVGAGVYLTLSRSLLHAVIGVSLLASAANLIMFTAGRPATMTPPLIPAGDDLLRAAANPLPQALVLTAIVIGFSLTCFSLVLVLALKQRTGLSDSHALRFAEPKADSQGQPALERDALPDSEGPATTEARRALLGEEA